MANITRKVMTKSDVVFIAQTYSIGNENNTVLDIRFNDKSLLNGEPIYLDLDDLADLVQILVEAQNT